MYRDLVQWEHIREMVLKEKKSQREVFRITGIDPKTIRKIIANKTPPQRKHRSYAHPRLDPHTSTIERLVTKAEVTPPGYKASPTKIFEHLRSSENYSGSYGAVRDYVSLLRKDESKQKISLDAWEHAHDTLISIDQKDSISFLYAMSNYQSSSLSKTKLKGYMRATALYAEKTSPKFAEPSAEEKAGDWLSSIVFGKIPHKQIVQDIGGCEGLSTLLTMVQSGNRITRNRALSVLASKKGISARATSRLIGVDPKSYSRYLNAYKERGVEDLTLRRQAANRKFDSKPLKDAIFTLLHEPPSNYDINRTTWKMADFKEVLAKNGYPACPDVIRKITKDAGYRWRKARVVLTSQDPEYREKLERIHDVLGNLKEDEAFFSIDEFGPFAIKTKGGRKLVGPTENFTVPQWQKSKGCLIMTAALELSKNQVTHFYSDKKNTDEMIKMMDILIKKYKGYRTLWLSWDAASWHISKKLYEHIDAANVMADITGSPKIDTVPLPAGAQFLNVIESVFSGFARSVVHNSDYKSVDEAKAAFDRYFTERNKRFLRNPKRAGKKIWGEERVVSVFNEANNCKDPRYR
jgi:transposase